MLRSSSEVRALNFPVQLSNTPPVRSDRRGSEVPKPIMDKYLCCTSDGHTAHLVGATSLLLNADVKMYLRVRE